MGGVPGGVAVAVGMIARRAVNSAFHPARGLCELPNPGIGNSAGHR